MAETSAETPRPPVVPGPWQLGTVTSVKRETPTVKSFRVSLPVWTPHLPGQHYELRLTAPDGYRAQRSYSIASSPLDEGEIELTVDRLDAGEVSPYLHDVLQPGDELEVRGPYAMYFTWRGESPLLLVGGGSGVVPLMSMLRHRNRTAPELPARLVFSVRTADDVIYADELGEETTVTYTRRPPPGWTGPVGRVGRDLLAPLVFDAGPVYVCGSNGFVESAVMALVELGYEPRRILTERFGPTS